MILLTLLSNKVILKTNIVIFNGVNSHILGFSSDFCSGLFYSPFTRIFLNLLNHQHDSTQIIQGKKITWSSEL